nr:hypothetical protein [Candidatus Njordarchaeum guaymaensis]
MYIQLYFHCASCKQVLGNVRDRVQIHLLPQPNQITRTEDFAFFPSTIKVSVVNVDESNELLKQFATELKEDFNIKVTWVAATAEKAPAKVGPKVELRPFQKEESYTL